MAEVRELASGLKFPEGPVAMADGSVVLVEIQAGRISRVSPDGSVDVVAEPGGGPNGSAIREAIWGLQSPNGIGRSPDGGTVYVAETWTGRLWSWKVSGPGLVEPEAGLVEHGGHLVAGLPDLQLFDSLGVDAEGNVCVATIITTGGGITSISPDG